MKEKNPKNLSSKSPVATGFTMFGDETSPVTIIEFTDYQCPFCARFHHDVFKQIQTKYWVGSKSSVRFVVRNFPLSFHENAMDLARVTECTREDIETDAGPLATKIFKEQYLKGSSVTLKDVYSWIQNGTSGMDLRLIQKCVRSGKRDSQIQADIEAGTALGVSGTPSFIIIAPDGTTQLIQGAVPFETFKTAIDAALLKK